MEADSTPPAARVRTGGLVISLCGGPLNVPILHAHAKGPLRLPELRKRIGGVAQTTLREHTANLREVGLLAKREDGATSHAVENELTRAGLEVLSAAKVLGAWLAGAPQGPVNLGSEAAKGAIRALIGGWGSTMLRCLAARPRSLTELDGLIPDLSYPAIERRLSAMRAAGQVELSSGGERGRPYAVTEWTRRAVAPLAVAGRCECQHMERKGEAATPVDIEAAFLLAVPLVKLRGDHKGSCLLAVDTGVAKSAGTNVAGSKHRLAGVRVAVEDGRVVACACELERNPCAWALGTVETWLDAIIEDQLEGLRTGGEDSDLVHALLADLHRSLFPV
jgi:DNA-binding HxlR family transcriptional regulator